MNDVEEFITYKGCIYKKVGDITSLIKICPNCQKQYFTKEQRQVYCCGACKSQAFRAKKTKSKGIINLVY